MARKTIYVKPEKEELYEKAVRLSNKRSLSALIEEAVENLVKEREHHFKDVLMAAALSRSAPPPIIELLVLGYRTFIEKEMPELWDAANHALDIFAAKGLFLENKGVWVKNGDKSVSENKYNLDDVIWYRGINNDLSWLDEMYEIVIGPEFTKLEEEYYDDIKKTLKDILPKDIYKKASSILDKRRDGSHDLQ